MKRRLPVPATLVFTLGTAGAVIAAASSCGGEEAPKDASSCSVFCFENRTDGGPQPPDGGCPLCADFTSGAPVCPAGCEPLG